MFSTAAPISSPLSLSAVSFLLPSSPLAALVEGNDLFQLGLDAFLPPLPLGSRDGNTNLEIGREEERKRVLTFVSPHYAEISCG